MTEIDTKSPRVAADRAASGEPEPTSNAKPAARTAATGEIRDGEKLVPAPMAIKNEDTKSLSLQKPGDKAAGPAEAGQKKELGFIRSALGWLREHVAKNPFIRAAVSIASLLIPGLGFLSLIMLALDGILLLDKLIAGEKISLGDIFSFAASATAAAVSPKTLLPLSQLAVAGYQLFERWLKKLAAEQGQVAAVAATSKDQLDARVAELRHRTEAMLARKDAGALDNPADRQLVQDLATTLAAINQKERQLGPDKQAERDALRNLGVQVSELVAQIDKARPGWMEKLSDSMKAPAGPEATPSPA